LKICFPFFPFQANIPETISDEEFGSLQSMLQIEDRIFTIRGLQVMLDSDLAELYGVETKVMNQTVKRNVARFPERYRFQLTTNEMKELVTICDRLNRLKHSSANPFVFTEHGVSMLATVLRSSRAVSISIQIIDAFVGMRKMLTIGSGLLNRLNVIDHKLQDADKKFQQIFQALEARNSLPETGIFFEGQVFDAWMFVSDLVKSAEKSIILIDNYIDDTVLKLLSKRQPGVSITLYTRKITPDLALEAEKFNNQYKGIEIRVLTTFHDRFLIIDETALYHIGASLKDLGKKWFAFSRIDALTPEVLNKLNG
jgi:hypothetical protein